MRLEEDIRMLREELARMRERVAVLEAERRHAAAPVRQLQEYFIPTVFTPATVPEAPPYRITC